MSAARSSAPRAEPHGGVRPSRCVPDCGPGACSAAAPLETPRPEGCDSASGVSPPAVHQPNHAQSPLLRDSPQVARPTSPPTRSSAKSSRSTAAGGEQAAMRRALRGLARGSSLLEHGVPERTEERTADRRLTATATPRASGVTASSPEVLKPTRGVTTKRLPTGSPQPTSPSRRLPDAPPPCAIPSRRGKRQLPRGPGAYCTADMLAEALSAPPKVMLPRTLLRYSSRPGWRRAERSPDTSSPSGPSRLSRSPTCRRRPYGDWP